MTCSHMRWRPGDALIEAHQHIPHGKWEAWLRHDCELSVRTAARYVQLAKARSLFEIVKCVAHDGIDDRRRLTPSWQRPEVETHQYQEIQGHLWTFIARLGCCKFGAAARFSKQHRIAFVLSGHATRLASGYRAPHRRPARCCRGGVDRAFSEGHQIASVSAVNKKPGRIYRCPQRYPSAAAA